MGVDRGRGVAAWLLDSMSSTHNESRLAACPLSGVQERIRAPVNQYSAELENVHCLSALSEAVNLKVETANRGPTSSSGLCLHHANTLWSRR